jgi:hypothetical protein
VGIVKYQKWFKVGVLAFFGLASILATFKKVGLFFPNMPVTLFHWHLPT